MRTILFVSFLATAASFSTDLIKEHVINGLDKNVSPCDDFYAHVCPIKMTMEQTTIYRADKMFQDALSKLDVNSIFPGMSRERTFNFVEDVYRLADLRRTCEESNEGRQLIAQLVSIMVPSNSTPNLTCDQCSQIFGSTTFNDSYTAILRTHKTASYAVAFTILMSSAGLHSFDSFTESLFEEIKVTLREIMKQTPWLHTYKAVDKYLDFVDHQIRYTPFTVSDTWGLREIINRQIEVAENCAARLRNTDIATACIMLGVVSRGDHNVSSRFNELAEYAISDVKFNAWNIQNGIFVSRPYQLLGYSLRDPAAIARKFGLFGNMLSHEIMHSLFHSGLGDPPELQNYWTNSSACVTRQYNATCKAFLQTNCVSGTTNTFEEDGADVAGMRLAYTTFKKATSSINSDVEGITQDQMFFYAYAATWCLDKNFRFAKSDNIHSQNYVRTNSLVSQMNEWKTAFKCRDDSRMVRTKTDHCSIYGFDAPFTRKKTS